MTYFEEDTQLRDILITGGDALMSQNKTLSNNSGSHLPHGCPKTESQSGTPGRRKVCRITTYPLWIAFASLSANAYQQRTGRNSANFQGESIRHRHPSVHYSNAFPNPTGGDSRSRGRPFANYYRQAGSFTNQLVYNVAASRRGHTTRLRQVLNSLGVVCYYTFSVKGFKKIMQSLHQTAVPCRSSQEEKRFGKLIKKMPSTCLYCLKPSLTRQPASGVLPEDTSPSAFSRHRPQCVKPARHRQEHDVQSGRHHPRESVSFVSTTTIHAATAR